MNKYPFLLIFIIITFVKCTTIKPVVLSNEEMADISKFGKETEVAQFQEGKSLYRNNCSACHRLYLPDSYKKEDWDVILKDMFVRSKMADQIQKDRIKDYLLFFAKK